MQLADRFAKLLLTGSRWTPINVNWSVTHFYCFVYTGNMFAIRNVLPLLNSCFVHTILVSFLYILILFHIIFQYFDSLYLFFSQERKELSVPVWMGVL